MAELSISETTTFRWSFEEDVEQYAAAGIAAIGVWRHKLSDCGLPMALDLLNKTRMKVSHLSWAGGFTGSDGRTHRESIEDAVEALGAAAALHCPTLVLYTGPRAGHTAGHARRLFKAAMAELAPRADELGVTLAIEPMHSGCAAEWTFLSNLDDTLSLLAEVGHPRVRMVLDTYHLGLADCSDSQAKILPHVIGQAAPYVALVQLGDGRRPPCGEQNRCRLGEGVVPLREMIAALQAQGYDGYYDFELLGEEFETANYHDLLEHAKSVFRDLVID